MGGHLYILIMGIDPAGAAMDIGQLHLKGKIGLAKLNIYQDKLRYAYISTNK